MTVEEQHQPQPYPLPSSRWPLVLGASLIFATWMLPLTAAIWDAVDESVFYALNGTLAWSPKWQWTMAMANHRIFDVIVAICYVALCAGYIFESGGKRALRRTAELTALILLLIVVRYILGTALDLLDYKRSSPSRVLEPALLLSELVPELAAKDGSRYSFPGDHALVALFASLYFYSRAPRRFVLPVTLLLVGACLPRLFSGAHWLSDIMVGSFLFASLAWFTADSTRVFDWLAGRLEPWLGRPVQRVRRCLRQV